MCTPWWLNFYALDWNYLPVGREFEGKCLTGPITYRLLFLKNITPPPHPPICHMCDSFDTEANKWERRKYDTYKWVKQKQTNKKKQRRFACNYIALVSDFIWSWYAFKNAAEVCIIRHFNKTLVELQQKLNNIKNQCLTKFLAKPWRTTWDSAVDVLP